MTVWPLQFRKLDEDDILFSDDAGAFFRSSEAFLNRYVDNELTDDDSTFLKRGGHTFGEVGDPAFVSFASRWTQRINPATSLGYIILVPTLRCNLMCDYCQVSRAAETAKGFDWDDAKLAQVIELLDSQSTTEIKIEFQGGEPLLRVDLLEAVRTFCRNKFTKSEFVICTNLQNVSDDAWLFLEAEDTYVSTSFDGTSELHQTQRTKTASAHKQFNANLDIALQRIGPDRVSALPTIDPSNPPEPNDVIGAFASRGFGSIFLRRVNYQGFARKKYGLDRSRQEWTDYYRRFVRALISHNATSENILEEYYLSHTLRRIIQGGHHNHVDLRNPNWLGIDYLVVDFDGKLYPTDEARMVSRVGQIDLTIGSLNAGLDVEKISAFNQHASNFEDPDCMHCVYKAYCGLDLVDDLSRYGRIDIPRHQTEHCRSHMDLFDFAFELLYSDDPKVRKSIASWLQVPRYSPELAQRHS